eukprot:4119927-Pyramimonas_sp.AAC.1
MRPCACTCCCEQGRQEGAIVVLVCPIVQSRRTRRCLVMSRTACIRALAMWMCPLRVRASTPLPLYVFPYAQGPLSGSAPLARLLGRGSGLVMCRSHVPTCSA